MKEADRQWLTGDELRLLKVLQLHREGVVVSDIAKQTGFQEAVVEKVIQVKAK